MTMTPAAAPTVDAPVEYIFALDPAQASDFSALALLKLTAPGSARLDSTALPFMNDLAALTRWKGVSYPEQVRRVAKLAADPRLRPIFQPPARVYDGGRLVMRDAEVQAPKPKLVVDATGVGRAVVDMFVTPEVLAVADVVPLTITSGESWRRERWGKTGLLGYWVSKRELCSLLVARLQGERLRFRPGDKLAGVLEDELRNFRVKVTKAAHETFEAREGKNDDLVLAVAMALWTGENGRGRKIRVI
jgi:hypothetical protein